MSLGVYVAAGGIVSLKTRAEHIGCWGPGLYPLDAVPKPAPVVSLLCCRGFGGGHCGQVVFCVGGGRGLEPVVTEELGTGAELGVGEEHHRPRQLGSPGLPALWPRQLVPDYRVPCGQVQAPLLGPSGDRSPSEGETVAFPRVSKEALPVFRLPGASSEANVLISFIFKFSPSSKALLRDGQGTQRR